MGYSDSLKSYTNVILTLSVTKAEKFACAKYLGKYLALPKMFDKLIATKLKFALFFTQTLRANHKKCKTTDNLAKRTHVGSSLQSYQKKQLHVLVLLTASGEISGFRLMQLLFNFNDLGTRLLHFVMSYIQTI